MLPSLHLSGRCFLYWAQRLQQQLPYVVRELLPNTTTSSSTSSKGLPFSPWDEDCCAFLVCFGTTDPFDRTLIGNCVTATHAWFRPHHVHHQLAAAGYEVLPLLLQLEAFLAAEQQARSNMGEPQLQTYIQTMQAIGRE